MKYNFFSFVFALIVGVVFVPCSFVYSQSQQESKSQNMYNVDPLLKSALQANRRTALRCLNLAKDYAGRKDWKNVISQSSLGISYDPSISDLWYMLSAAEKNLGRTRADVYTHVLKALTVDTWAEYNRDSARILYADILCDTGRSAEVFGVLDGTGSDVFASMPFIYSADAEFIRIKAYYRLADSVSIRHAREKIDTCRRVYPNDSRFPLLFFTYENPSSLDPEVNRIASALLFNLNQNNLNTSLDDITEEDIQLEIRAARFAKDKQQLNMLKAFNAKELKHPLYIVPALDNGLLTQEQALEYLKSFADSKIDYEIMLEVISAITDTSVKEKLVSYLKSYEGTIIKDTNLDCIADLTVSYKYGRPKTIIYDSNQDGIIDWKIDCDYGQPVFCTLTSENCDFRWNDFPFVESVAIKNENGNISETFRLMAHELQWTPVLMQKDVAFNKIITSDFYFPIPASYKNNSTVVDEMSIVTNSESSLNLERLLNASYNVEVPTQERENAVIIFLVLNGKIQLAQYLQNGRLYAQAEFSDNAPLFRLVDEDGDGVFETTEFYAEDKEGNMDVYSLEEERSVMINLFGAPSNGGHFYLRMVQIDSPDDSNTMPNFTEEYLSHNGRISSWDTDGDGSWNVRYVRYPTEYNAEGKTLPLKEDTMFFDNEKNLVTVSLIDGKPVKVRNGAEELSIIEDKRYIFYWLGTDGGSENAEKVIKKLNQTEHKAVSVIIDLDKDKRIIGIRAGDFCYGKIIQKQALEEAGKDE